MSNSWLIGWESSLSLGHAGRKGVVMTDVTRRKLLGMAAIGALGFSAPALADAPDTYSPEEIVDTGHRFFGSI
jgi:hypothetical protein